MHFDILVPDEIKDRAIIYGYGEQYLEKKGEQGQRLNAKQCNFCHIQEAPSAIEESVAANGYYILEMEGCN